MFIKYLKQCSRKVLKGFGLIYRKIENSKFKLLKFMCKIQVCVGWKTEVNVGPTLPGPNPLSLILIMLSLFRQHFLKDSLSELHGLLSVLSWSTGLEHGNIFASFISSELYGR